MKAALHKCFSVVYKKFIDRIKSNELQIRDDKNGSTVSQKSQ